MKVLVINCGSSSIKYQLLDMETETAQIKGLVERIGIEGSMIKQEGGGHKEKYELDLPNHEAAIAKVMELIVDPAYGVISSLDEIEAVGHRVVHGGEYYSESVVIDENVLKVLDQCTAMAPLHNPPNIDGIKAAMRLMPGVTNVAVFDTAFHQTMPPESYLYAIPYELYQKHGIRKYGFHGSSHKFMATETAELLNIDVNDLKLITCHLGNGASVSAIKHGRSVDTSMGYTPLEGLVMGTRSGDLDPSIVSTISEKEGISEAEVTQMLNKQSGVLGISGVSSDFRDLEQAMNEGNKRANLALKIFAHKVRFYIGAYIAEMNGVDAIVFSGGIGENSASMREMICKNLGNLGIKLDDARNNGARDVDSDKVLLSADDSKVKVFVVEANEELVIARETEELTIRHSR